MEMFTFSLCCTQSPTGPAIVRLATDAERDKSGSEKPVKYSGNPGYIVGEPLRVGTLEISHHRKMYPC